MLDWLTNDVGGDVPSWEIVGSRLVLAAVAGGLVAGSAKAAHAGRRADGPVLITTLVLLTVLVAMVTLVIGNSVARAFGLVGALSIVRFRTVVDDTRDTAFVIFAVIVGMAIGAGVLSVPLVGLPLVALLAIGMERWKRPGPVSTATTTARLTLRIGLGPEILTRVWRKLDELFPQAEVLSSATARQGAALELYLRVGLPAPNDARQWPTMVAALNQVEGVQAVELGPL